MTKIAPTIIMDSREQLAWEFPNLPSERAGLDTGDYSVKGLEYLICLERKSLDDLLGCVGRERERFERELARMRGYRFRLVIVEASAADLAAGGWRSKVHPNAVTGSLIAWGIDYGLMVWPAGDRDAACEYAERWLYRAALRVAREAEAVGALSPSPEPEGVLAP